MTDISTLESIYPKNKEFTKDIQKVKLPFDLVDALRSVIVEIVENNFKYSKFTKEQESLLSFKKGQKEIIVIGVTSENLLIRHFDVGADKRKLRVLYIAKPQQRKFKLL
jgi:hypothetical protein